MPYIGNAPSALPVNAADLVGTPLGVLVTEFATPVATTSGTAKGFTGLPSGIVSFSLGLVGVSMASTGTSNIIAQLSSGAAFQTTGYVSNAFGSTNAGLQGTVATPNTDGLLLMSIQAAAATWYGLVYGVLVDSSTNTWAVLSNLNRGDTGIAFASAGEVALSAALDGVQIKARTGTDVFDAGILTLSYQRVTS